MTPPHTGTLRGWGLALLAAVALLVVVWQLLPSTTPPLAASSPTADPDIATTPGLRTASPITSDNRTEAGTPSRSPVTTREDAASTGALTARILEPGGRPAAEVWATITLEGDDRAVVAIVTDAAGALAVPLTEPFPTARAPLPGERVTVVLESNRKSLRPFGAFFDEPPDKNIAPRAARSFAWSGYTDSVDLGDVRLEHAPLLVSGIVVDALERPVSTDGLQWALATRLPAPPSIEYFSIGIREGEEFYAWADEGGRFTLYGTAPDNSLGLRIRVRDAERSLRTFDPSDSAVGVRGVVLRLMPERTIVAKIRITGTADLEAIDVRVLDDFSWTKAWETDERVTLTPREGYVEVTVSPVRSGRHDVLFLLDGVVAVRLRDVDVPADEPCTDPRLDDIVVHGH